MFLSIALSTLSLSLTAHADTCGDIQLDSTDTLTIFDTADGPVLPLGDLQISSIDPDEIDLTSTCLPTITLGPIVVKGIEGEDIDFALTDEGSLEILFVDEDEPTAREHVLLARQVGVPLRSQLLGGTGMSITGMPMPVTTMGTVVLLPIGGELYEQTDRAGTTTRQIILTFEIDKTIPDEAVEIDTVLFQDGTVDPDTDLWLTAPPLRPRPEVPICGHCKSDIAK